MFMLMLRRPGATRRHWCHKKVLVPQEGTGATRRHLCHTRTCYANEILNPRSVHRFASKDGTRSGKDPLIVTAEFEKCQSARVCVPLLHAFCIAAVRARCRTFLAFFFWADFERSVRFCIRLGAPSLLSPVIIYVCAYSKWHVAHLMQAQ